MDVVLLDFIDCNFIRLITTVLTVRIQNAEATNRQSKRYNIDNYHYVMWTVRTMSTQQCVILWESRDRPAWHLALGLTVRAFELLATAARRQQQLEH